MTRKDYILISDAIADGYAKAIERFPPGQRPDVIIRTLADYLARDNARFERTRFLVACGVTP